MTPHRSSPWRRFVARATTGLLALATAANSTFAAIAFDAASNGGLTSSGSTFSWSHTLGGGSDRALVVGVAAEDTSTTDLTVSAVRINGVALTAVPNSTVTVGSGTYNRAQLFYLLNSSLPAAGTYTMQVTFAGSVSGAVAGATSLTGVAQQSPEAVGTNSAASGSTLSTNLSVLTAGAWVVDVFGNGASNATSATSASGQTERWDRGTGTTSGAGSTKATTAAGSTALGWTTSSSGRLVQSLAAFAASGGSQTTYTLTTNISGSGTVTRSPDASSYAAGTVVTLTASPSAGYTFSGWSGDASGTSTSTTVTMSANRSVTATFTSSGGNSYTLTTSVVGSGTVTRSPDATSYTAGTVVTLTASPSSGYTFSGWSGDASGTSASTTVTMSANRSVTATFTSSGGGTSAEQYVSPSGTSGAAGTSSAPTDLATAITRIAAGGTIWVTAGTYNFSTGVTVARGNNGASGSLKKIYAVSGATPVLNFSAQALSSSNRGLTLNGHYWHVRGLVVEYAGDNGIYLGGNNNTVELCVTRFNRDTGLQLGRHNSSAPYADWPANNLILNCTSHDNRDPATNENADGFACKLTTGPGNVFRGCIAHHNIDDGWDLYAKTETGAIGPVLIENCVAHHNGTLSDGSTSGAGDKNGFKLGGDGIDVAHTIRRSLAFANGKHGFTDNNNQGPITVLNNTSFNNVGSNFQFREGGTHTFTNNASLQAGSSDKTIGTLTGTTNLFWMNNASNNNGGSLVISTADFANLSYPSPTFGRNADGSINFGTFARLASGSDLINAGSPSGTDIGAIESF